MGRLKSCRYCGRIHDSHFDCGKKPVTKKRTELDSFRSSGAWQRIRNAVRERDCNLCRLSLYYGEIVHEDLSVHHIEPLIERWDCRLDEQNLITLSAYWHERAEAGEVDRKLLHQLATTPPGVEEDFFGKTPHRHQPFTHKKFPK